jgi:hypothetical protein
MLDLDAAALGAVEGADALEHRIRLPRHIRSYAVPAAALPANTAVEPTDGPAAYGAAPALDGHAE